MRIVIIVIFHFKQQLKTTVGLTNNLFALGFVSIIQDTVICYII